ncbi:Rv3235 family protein [Amnibacterium sp.]|uniref:Rv3235 family protein n=1 Tax=Amnibacterium sp. TaxID=1872496 RepID=UPI003F7BFE13
MSAVPPPPARRHLAAVTADEYFERQATHRSQLPDPLVLVENLATGVVEVLGGVRDLEQLGRWLSEGVYRHLLRRSVIAARGRAIRGQMPGRPMARIAATRITYPAGNVVEATVILHGSARTRAVAIRLEGMDNRWRATALAVL